MQSAAAAPWLERSLAGLSRVSSRRPWLVLLIASAVGLAAGLAMSSMEVDATFLGIVDKDDADALHFQDVSQSFGGSGNIVLLVECEDLERGKAFLRALKPEVEALTGFVKGVDIRLDAVRELSRLDPLVVPLPAPAAETLRELLERHPERARELLQRPGVASFAALLEAEALSAAERGDETDPRAALTNLEGALTALERCVTGAQPLDPSELLPTFGPGESRAWEQQMIRDGWVVAPNGAALMATVRLKIDALNTRLGVDGFGDVLRVTEAVLERFEGVTADYAGAPAYGYEDQQSVLLRTRWLSALSLILVLALFFFVDRSVFGPFLVGLPLLLGTIWTFGLVWLFIGYVSITSAVFGILLFGLGVDFAIHIVVRYNDALADGASHEQAMDAAMILTGRGVVTGGLTSAAAFFGMLVHGNKAAQHLGITTGCGLLCCLVAMLTVLPALLTLTHRFKKVGERTSMDLPWLDAWVAFATRWPRAVLLVMTLLAATGLGLSRFARIEYDIEKIATRGTRALAAKRRIQELFGVSTDFALCLCDDVEDARIVTRQLRDPQLDAVTRVESVTDLLPGADAEVALSGLSREVQGLQPGPLRPALDPKDSARRLGATLTRFGALCRLRLSAGALEPPIADGLRRLVASVERILTRLRAPDAGARVAPLDAQLRELGARFAQALRAGTARPLGVEDLPAPVREKFVDARGRVLVFAFPRQSMLDAGAIKGFFDEVAPAAPNATGVGKIVYLFIAKSLSDMPLVIAIVSLIVLLVVGLDFRSARLALLVFVPLVFALSLAIGAVVLCGQVVSVLMLAGFPLILGIGVDDGVHLVHRLLEAPERGVVHAASQTGKAILMTSITTMVSFGGLLLMNHHGLEGLGFLVTVGVGLCFVCSVTVFPAVVALLAPRLPGLERSVSTPQDISPPAPYSEEPTALVSTQKGEL